ncbi:MAG: hypothetical protein ABIA63_01360 [bacterium]
MKKYLRLSHCDEILLSRDFSRTMLVSASSASGLSHVVYELLHREKGAGITTKNIPPEYMGKPYMELRNYFSGQNNLLLIGLLENTGNIIERKKEALREAQKNPDISRIITDLKSVKSLISNYPVINPDPDFIIKQNSTAVVIQGKSVLLESGEKV